MARQEIDYLVPLEQRPGWVDVSLWITRLGRASVTMATEISEPENDARPQPGSPARNEVGTGSGGRTVYARGSCVVVGWDVAARSSRSFDDEERAVFTAYGDGD